jgi:hypothetical protein
MRRHQNHLSDYGLARARDKAFDAVRALWAKRQSEGVKLKDVAQRIGADKGWVSKQLSGPGNWTLRTFGALVEGMDGEIDISVSPIELAPSSRPNYDAYDIRASVEFEGQVPKIAERRDATTSQIVEVTFSS